MSYPLVPSTQERIVCHAGVRYRTSNRLSQLYARQRASGARFGVLWNAFGIVFTERQESLLNEPAIPTRAALNGHIGNVAQHAIFPVDGMPTEAAGESHTPHIPSHSFSKKFSCPRSSSVEKSI